MRTLLLLLPLASRGRTLRSCVQADRGNEYCLKGISSSGGCQPDLASRGEQPQQAASAPHGAQRRLLRLRAQSHAQGWHRLREGLKSGDVLVWFCVCAFVSELFL